MTKPLPKWIQTRYAILWNHYKNKEFTFDQAEKVLKGNDKGINVFFSDLHKSGWIVISLSSNDSRKRIYKLISPEQGFKELGNEK